jgi:cobaltochelatase CobS
MTGTTTATATQLFGDIFPNQRGDSIVFAVRPKTDLVPSPNPDFHFELGDVQTLVAWENAKVRYCRNLLITGPKGCGKSELIFQYAARLGREVFRYSCHERTEYADLLGGLGIEPDGSTQWNDGPLAVAMRRGAILLVDEVNAARPGTLIGLNGVLDGSESITLPTGEIVKRHPEFRVAVTGNAMMRDDTAPSYKGTNTMNQAFLDRFIVIEKTYLPPHVEMQIISNAFERLLVDPFMNPDGFPVPSALLKAVIGFVATVRKTHQEGQSDMVISTRGLMAMTEFTALRWNAVRNDPEKELKQIAEKTLFGACSGMEKESMRRAFQIALETEKVSDAFGKKTSDKALVA